jgi:hypothetical protein
VVSGNLKALKDGIPLFGSLPHDVRLRQIATRHYPSGLVQTSTKLAAKRSLNRSGVFDDVDGEI